MRKVEEVERMKKKK